MHCLTKKKTIKHGKELILELFASDLLYHKLLLLLYYNLASNLNCKSIQFIYAHIHTGRAL